MWGLSEALETNWPQYSRGKSQTNQYIKKIIDEPVCLVVRVSTQRIQKTDSEALVNTEPETKHDASSSFKLGGGSSPDWFKSFCPQFKLRFRGSGTRVLRGVSHSGFQPHRFQAVSQPTPAPAAPPGAGAAAATDPGHDIRRWRTLGHDLEPSTVRPGRKARCL